MASLFLLVLTLGLLHLVDVGRFTHAKVRLQNGADAAAYSAAAVEARSLNFVAYVNRAKVANEVLMAQAASLAWSGDAYARAGTSLRGPRTHPICFVPDPSATAQILCTLFKSVWRPYLRGLGKFYRTVGKGMRKTGLSIPPWLPHYKDTVLTALQTVALYETVRALVPNLPGRQSLVETVLADNDPGPPAAELATLLSIASFTVHLGQWFEPTIGHVELHARKKGPAMERLAEVVEASLDGFSENRRARTWLPPPLLRLQRFGQSGIDTKRLRWKNSPREVALFTDFTGAQPPVSLGRARKKTFPALSSYWGVSSRYFVSARSGGSGGGSGELDDECRDDGVAREAPMLLLGVRRRDVGSEPASGLAAGSDELRALAWSRATYTHPEHDEQCGNLFQPYWEPRLVRGAPDPAKVASGNLNEWETMDLLLYLASIDPQLLAGFFGGTPSSGSDAKLAAYEEAP